MCGSRNIAAKAAQTEWLCFLDADDRLGPGYLDALRPYMAMSQLILAPYVSYVRNGVTEPPEIPNAGRWPEINDTVTGALIRRTDFERLGGWLQPYWPWSDWELWLRCEREGIKRLHVPKAVYIAYENGNGENSKLKLWQARELHKKVKRLHRPVWDAQ